MGRVPLLLDGSAKMFESAAILRYLGATYGSDTVLRRNARGRTPMYWAESSSTAAICRCRPRLTLSSGALDLKMPFTSPSIAMEFRF
ncbi:MAG: hypothetical protein ACKVP5_08520 [Aestuariivirga sp.]